MDNDTGLTPNEIAITYGKFSINMLVGLTIGIVTIYYFLIKR